MAFRAGVMSSLKLTNCPVSKHDPRTAQCMYAQHRHVNSLSSSHSGGREKGGGGGAQCSLQGAGESLGQYAATILLQKTQVHSWASLAPPPRRFFRMYLRISSSYDVQPICLQQQQQTRQPPSTRRAQGSHTNLKNELGRRHLRLQPDAALGAQEHVLAAKAAYFLVWKVEPK